MAGSVNKVILLGNLGQDPVVRTSQDGNKIVQLSIATSERWKDRNSGEQREKTEWHRVVIFNENLSNIAEQYLKKGSTIFLEGQLQTRKWQDQNGIDKYTTEIVLGKFRGELAMIGNRNDNVGIADAQENISNNHNISEPSQKDINPPIGGACNKCDGLGVQNSFDEKLVVPNPSLSLRAGAIAPWSTSTSKYYMQTLNSIARYYDFSIDSVSLNLLSKLGITPSKGLLIS